jgi:hypothetical protein
MSFTSEQHVNHVPMRNNCHFAFLRVFIDYFRQDLFRPGPEIDKRLLSIETDICFFVFSLDGNLIAVSSYGKPAN